MGMGVVIFYILLFTALARLAYLPFPFRLSSLSTFRPFSLSSNRQAACTCPPHCPVIHGDSFDGDLVIHRPALCNFPLLLVLVLA